MPRVLLRDTTLGEDPSPLVDPTSSELPASPGGTGRLQLLGEIARGGMGAILKGRDPDLGRDLAVKVLLEAHRDRPELVRRFVEEAQIAGQLQHPGIAPVYELGQFADLRPFFTMKLVKGRTLAEVLNVRDDPADELSSHLGTWLQVCQTVAYAHARGVIHRDLKPSNVMLGSFGEVQVMDWGLAKVLARGGVVDDATAGRRAAHETVIATARSGGGSETALSQTGSVMGTPAYMAPEQARGEVERLDERCDVFALGSILCEILTGRPAFLGRGSGEIQRKAALGDLADAFARLDACKADAALIALAKECLARETEDRLRDAGVLAERVSAYLAGAQERLRRAELARVEERARRRLITVAAAAVVLLGLAGAAGYAWDQRQRAERVARTAHAVDEALTDAARLRGEAQAALPGDATRWNEAFSAAKRAEGLLAQGEADAPLRGRVATLLAQLERERADAEEKAHRLEIDRALLAKLEAIRLSRAEHNDPKRTDSEYDAAFRAAGLDLDATDPTVAGNRLAARSEPIELANYLDDWTYIRRVVGRAEADWRRPVAAAQAADCDPWRTALRARVGATDRESLAEFRRLADNAKALDAQPATSLVLLAHQLKHAAQDPERAERVLRRAWDRFPGDFWINIELAGVHGADHGQSIEIYPRPVEAVRHLSAAMAIRSGSATARALLGLALNAQGKLDESIAKYREAIRLRPEDASAHNNLGIALLSLGKTDEALSEFGEAARLKPELALFRSNLASALMAQGKRKAAITELREAVRLQPARVECIVNLCNTLRESEELEKALIALRERVRSNPDSAGDHANLGMTLNRLARHEEAIVEHREVLRLQPDRAQAHNDLAWALALSSPRRPRDIEEALKHARRATELEPKHGSLYNTLGAAEFRAGNWEKAVATFRMSMERQKGGDAYDWFFLAMAQWHLRKKDEAQSWFEKAVAWTLANAPGDIQLLDFWAEAAELLGGKAPGPGGAHDATTGGQKRPGRPFRVEALKRRVD
jgi:serine/threonine-protein kinase